MKTCYLSAKETVELRQTAIPQVDEHSVLIKVHAAGICGSDLHAFLGSHPFRKPPMVLGHEAAGEIVKIGTAVEGFRIGDRVTVEPVKTCEQCAVCKSGHYNICADKVMAGVKGWLGTFAEYFVIDAKRVYKLPDLLSYDLGVLTEPLAVGAHAVRVGKIQSGAVCAVLGTGTIGLFTGLAASYAGADHVFCTDLNPFRLQMAKNFGLLPLQADQVSVEDEIHKIAPEGPDVVFLALSSPAVLRQAVKLVKPGGTIVIIGVFSKPAELDLNHIQVNEIQLCGSNIYTSLDFQRALDILADRPDTLRAAITHQVNFADVEQALQMLADPANQAIKVIVTP